MPGEALSLVVSASRLSCSASSSQQKQGMGLFLFALLTASCHAVASGELKKIKWLNLISDLKSVIR